MTPAAHSPIMPIVPSHRLLRGWLLMLPRWFLIVLLSLLEKTLRSMSPKSSR